MLGTFLLAGFLGLFFSAATVAQDIDANPSTTANRSPSPVAEQISDRAERAAFLQLYSHKEPQEMLQHAKAFLKNFPQSAFLSQAYEIAARGSFDLRDYKGGMQYAKESLALLPENPLLLLALADVEAREHMNEAAIMHARDALDYLERFGRPGSIAEREWTALKPRLKATAHFAIGRALLLQALASPPGEKRIKMLKDCEASLFHAEALNSDDPEFTYLMGLARLSGGELVPAAGEFATISSGKSPFAPKALEYLQRIYKTLHPDAKVSFEVFMKEVSRRRDVPRPASAQASISAKPLSDYAGSDTCRTCHGNVYRAWSEIGMSRMLRPYRPENVIGDFQTNNQYFEGDQTEYRDGKLEVARGENRSLFARMVVRNGSHYFEIKQSDDKWHSYPVDYTIGSKWQQAYATKLPNGQIHVFPVQYNARYKQWLNYWKMIDNPGSERADLHSWEKLGRATSYQAICAVCHTSQLQNVKGGGFEPDNIEFREPGIDCEMCHGPSARHVAEMSGGEEYEKGPLDPPVDFHKINNRDFVAICSQCHMQSAIRTPGPNGELNYSRHGEFFMRNPSIPFGEFSRTGFYKDGRFRQTTFIVESLRRSQCFKKGQVSCGTCHTPHGHDSVSNPTSLKSRDQTDRMCTGCHTDFQDSTKLVAHTHHALDSEGSRCVSCHMPRIMDALLFRARSHQIDDIPNAEMTLRFGQQESPNACQICHSQKDAQWVSQRLSAWNVGR
jgi:predicted CXXCH cytochrome family protein